MYEPEFNKSGTSKHSYQCTAAFGKRDPDCRRCAELTAGAPARSGWQAGYFKAKVQNATSLSREIAAHFAPGGPHALGTCGPVCTAFDW